MQDNALRPGNTPNNTPTVLVLRNEPDQAVAEVKCAISQSAGHGVAQPHDLSTRATWCTILNRRFPIETRQNALGSKWAHHECPDGLSVLRPQTATSILACQQTSAVIRNYF